MTAEHRTCQKCRGRGLLEGIRGDDGITRMVVCEVCHGFGKIGPWLDGEKVKRKKNQDRKLAAFGRRSLAQAATAAEG